MTKLRLPTEIKHRTFRFDVKAVDDEQGLIEAYGSIFNNVDDGDDTVKPGAFKRTIQNSKTRVQEGKAKFLAVMLYQHDADKPIGGWTDMKEDATGLLCKGQLVLSTQLGKETYELIKAGVINQFSIGYDIPSGGAIYDKSTGVRNLTEIRLWEISVVTFAMNNEALLQSVKANTHKGKTMDKKHNKQTKDFNDRFRQQQIANWLCDLDGWCEAIKEALLDMFLIGDSPQADLLDTVLNASQDNKIGAIPALEAWVQRGVDLDVANYLVDDESQDNYAVFTQPNWLGEYASMSSDRILARKLRKPTQGKAGASISAANQQHIDDHVANIKSLISAHAKAMRSEADDFASIMQGAEPTYTAPNAGTPDNQEGKRASYFSGTRTHQTHSPQSGGTATDDELSEALASLQLINLS